MAEGKKGFVLYADLIHTVSKMPKEKAGELFIHILEYVNDLNPETDDLIINLTFEPIKQQLKRDLKKYESICNRNQINGLKGGRPKNPIKPKKPTGLTGNPDKPKKPDKEKDTDNDKVNVKDIKERENDFNTKILSYQDEYNIDLLNNFFNYWSQYGENDIKMLFEKQKSFEIKKRLQTWKRNEGRFKKQGFQNNQTGNAGSKETILPSSDLSTEWSKDQN